MPNEKLLMLKTAFLRKEITENPHMEPCALRVKGVKVNPDRLYKFQGLCGFSASGLLPVTYPGILALGLQLQILQRPEFPFPALGAIHLGNHIWQKRAIKQNESLDYTVSFDSYEKVEKGFQFDLVVDVEINDEKVWRSVSTVLVRHDHADAPKRERVREQEPDYQQLQTWELAANLGLKYAVVSGDFNPIHLWPWSAKMMGFKNHIIHGMYNKARALSVLLPETWQGEVDVDVSYKLPVFLPSTVTLHAIESDAETQFSVRDKKGRRPHLVGTIKMGSEQEKAA